MQCVLVRFRAHRFHLHYPDADSMYTQFLSSTQTGYICTIFSILIIYLILMWFEYEIRRIHGIRGICGFCEFIQIMSITNIGSIRNFMQVYWENTGKNYFQTTDCIIVELYLTYRYSLYISTIYLRKKYVYSNRFYWVFQIEKL